MTWAFWLHSLVIVDTFEGGPSFSVMIGLRLVILAMDVF
jgi:hypothetical protein